MDISSTNSLATAVSSPRVLIAAGGTGGHVFPAIAIADAVRELQPSAIILFVGTRNRMEWEAVPKAGYDIESVWISGFHRRFTLQNVLFPLKVITSVFQSLLITKKFRPDIVIACGGFVSGPVGWIAAKLGIPLILQEQNSFPGLTNRMLSKYADTIFTAFDDAANYLPEKKVQVSGNPVRTALIQTDRTKALQTFQFNADQPVLLILGGSGGAESLNQAMIRHLDALHHELNLQIIWQCGKKYYHDLEYLADPGKYPNLRLVEFLDDMPSAYASANLVISRAGASSCSELMITGTPSILVPSPNVAGDHQTKNAEALVNKEAAVMIADAQIENQLFKVTQQLILDPEQLQKMKVAAKQLAKPDASKIIAKEVLNRSMKDS